MSSITGTYASPNKINGAWSGLHLGLNGDVSQDHNHSPEHGSRIISTAKEPFYRVDTLGLKKRLLDSIGGDEDAMQYWQYLAQFLKGKLRREEFETLVKPVLDTHVKRQLHNQLLMAIMYNASSTLPIASTPTLSTDPSHSSTSHQQGVDGYCPTSSLKRPLDDAEAADVIQPKSRVRQWALSLPRSERKKIKGLQDMEGRYGLKDWCEMSRGWQGRGRVRSTDTLAQTEALRQTGSPLCMSTRAMPPVSDLSSRIRNMANLYGLQEGVAEELGSFMSIALEYHMNDLISSAIELKRHRSEEQDVAPRPVAPMEVDTELDAKEDRQQQSPDNVSDSLRPESTEDEKSQEAKDPEPKALAEAENKSLPIQGNPGSSRFNDQNADDQSSDYRESQTLRLDLADLEDFFTVAPHIHPHMGSATYRLRNGLARAVEEQERMAEQLMQERLQENDELAEHVRSVLPGALNASSRSPALPTSSGANSQPVTRSGTPNSIFRKGAPSVLPNIPRIEISSTPPGAKPGIAAGGNLPQAAPYSPSTPRPPATGEGGILLSRSKRSTLASNPTEVFRAEMEARGILKSIDRAAGAHGGVANAQSISAGQSVSGDGYDATERQLHVHHWNYVDPAVILKDILG